MKDLIEALTILLKYGNPEYPFNCNHDELLITSAIKPDSVSTADKIRLSILGFDVSEDGDNFYSFKYGSC